MKSKYLKNPLKKSKWAENEINALPIHIQMEQSILPDKSTPEAESREYQGQAEGETTQWDPVKGLGREEEDRNGMAVTPAIRMLREKEGDLKTSQTHKEKTWYDWIVKNSLTFYSRREPLDHKYAISKYHPPVT